MFINEDFIPRREDNDRLPPGQYEESGFPVLSLGPTPEIELAEWKLEVTGLVDKPLTWNWDTFNALPKEQLTRTNWEGVPFETILALVGLQDAATHLIAHSYDGYTTNLPIEDVREGKAMVATAYDYDPIQAKHGGPARLLVPHLYFWKSAKWLNKLEFTNRDIPGFWETRGYHNYGNPWEEERYS